MFSKYIFVGFDYSGHSIKAVSLQKTNRGWKILHCQEIPKEGNANPLSSIPKNSILVTALSSRDVLARTCETELTREKDIKASLEFQIEPLIPYSIGNALFQYRIIEKSNTGTLLSVFSVRKDHLQQHLNVCERFHMTPEIVTFNSFAMAAAVRHLSDCSSPAVTIHIGEKETTCALIHHDNLLASRVFKATGPFAVELQKNLFALTAHHKNSDYETILLLGGDPQMALEIENMTGKKVHLPSWERWGLAEEKLKKFGLALAIALSGGAKKGINFRQNEFAYPFRWRKFKNPLIAFFSIAAALFFSLFLFSRISLLNLQTQAWNESISFLSYEGEKMEATFPKAPQAIISKMEEFSRKLDASPKIFPLHPPAPKVTDVLAWLSSFPYVQGGDIHFDSFHYAMIEHPKLNCPNKKYTVKVTLDMTAPNAGKARAFHEALLKPDSWIDHSQEIQWESRNDRYHISFILKEKPHV